MCCVCSICRQSFTICNISLYSALFMCCFQWGYVSLFGGGVFVFLVCYPLWIVQSHELSSLTQCCGFSFLMTSSTQWTPCPSWTVQSHSVLWTWLFDELFHSGLLVHRGLSSLTVLWTWLFDELFYSGVPDEKAPRWETLPLQTPAFHWPFTPCFCDCKWTLTIFFFHGALCLQKP